jgi:hypothetical protein
MLALIHLRPYWQLIGPCAGESTDRKTLHFSDPFWSSNNAPWNCSKEDCDCRIYSLSRIELKRYVEGGCSKGDEAAASFEITYP